MALLQSQQGMKEIGRIRCGDSVEAVSKSGKPFRRPRKLDVFKFTTHSRSIAESVANIFGGEIEHDPRLGYGVVTQTSEIPVVIPPGDAVITQAFELWDGGACLRRCDGNACLTWKDGRQIEVACMCPPEGLPRVEAAQNGNACKPTTRLKVMVPDLPDIGVWRIESRGFYAKEELGDTARILIAARDAETYLPARLWLDKRSKAIPGQKIREWHVPMLTIDASLRQLAGAGTALAAALPASPPDRKAITAGHEDARERTPDVHEPGDDEPIDAEIVHEETSQAQQIADRAAESTSKAVLQALLRRATELGVLDEEVDVAGATGSLGGYLSMRLG